MKMENRITNISKGENDKMSYSDLIKIVVNTPIPQGMTIADMKVRMDIMEQCDTGMDFTASQITELKTFCASQKWNIVSRDLIEFSDYIESF